MRRVVEDVTIVPDIERYIVDLVSATRTDRQVAVGASPRGSLALHRTGQTRAAMAGRDYVIPDDVKRLAEPVDPPVDVTAEALQNVTNKHRYVIAPFTERRHVDRVDGQPVIEVGAQVPGVLLVAPPPIRETDNPDFGAMFAGRIEESHMLASMYADLADDQECGFFDAATVSQTTSIDGVHLDAANTKAIGKALAPVVSLMLGL